MLDTTKTHSLISGNVFGVLPPYHTMLINIGQLEPKSWLHILLYKVSMFP